ncbi:ABC transporter permease [Telluribacter sp.]|jgi:putative ABC transport system permease protein|uniref:ABC transporter permease n=1 Tax=Telluribacter sp. TaxID=1978767 RepID=UPI002E0F2665|nr:ABC transporter permease [Telluribacter sp.]
MFQNYLKIAGRNLLAQRTYTALNTIGMAVGMAGAVLIFLYVRHHLSTDRHHSQFEKIYRINTDLYLEDGSIEYNPEAPLPLAQVLRTDYPQVENAAFLIMNRDLTVSVRQRGQAAPLRIREAKGTGLVEPTWFKIWDYEWIQGNPENALLAPNTAVLTQAWAKKYFGDTNPIGQVLTLNNKTEVTITGLLADAPPTTDLNLGLFISMATLKGLYPEYEPDNWYYLNSTNRLYVTLRQPGAAASIRQTFPALSQKQYGADADIFRFGIQPLREVHFDVARGGGAIRVSLLWSLGIVGLLLVVAACINFINLATVQALRRSKEVGIRKTLGSTRVQLIRQFLSETTLVILAAGGLALLLVAVSLPLFTRWVQVDLSFRLDGLTVAFFSLLPVLVILVAGGYPALVLSGFSPRAALQGKFTTGTGSRFTVRRALVIVQFAVCQALLLAALVVAYQIRFIRNADLGFRKNGVVVVSVPPKQNQKLDAFRQSLSQYPTIKSISFSHRPPSSDQLFGGSFKFDGKPDWEPYPIRDRLADANYLSTYGLKLIAGRNIQPSDTIREYLVNETLLHKLGFRDPQEILGKNLQYHLSSVPLPVVGVVKDFHQKSLREEIGPCIIASQADWYSRAGIWISGQETQQTLDHIRQTWLRFFPDEVFEYQYLDEQLAQFYETETLLVRLINTFTGMAILICCLGLYGLVSQVVVQRTKEIGIRKVLGASVNSIVALLSREFLLLVLLAIVIASPVAWYFLNQWLQNFVYKVSVEWWLFAVAGVLATGVALLTVSVQSIRAALMNPVKSLKTE